MTALSTAPTDGCLQLSQVGGREKQGLPCTLSKSVLVTNRHDDSAVRREALFLHISDGREESQEVKTRRLPQSLLLWLVTASSGISLRGHLSAGRTWPTVAHGPVILEKSVFIWPSPPPGYKRSCVALLCLQQWWLCPLVWSWSTGNPLRPHNEATFFRASGSSILLHGTPVRIPMASELKRKIKSDIPVPGS